MTATAAGKKAATAAKGMAAGTISRRGHAVRLAAHRPACLTVGLGRSPAGTLPSVAPGDDREPGHVLAGDDAELVRRACLSWVTVPRCCPRRRRPCPCRLPTCAPYASGTQAGGRCAQGTFGPVAAAGAYRQWVHGEVQQFMSARRWLAGHLATVLLLVTGGCLAAGGILHLAGAVDGADMAWMAGGAVGAAYSLWTMLASLRRGRLGVDVIALLALVGALVVGEYLAAAVISVMVASGRALEGWAAGRARRDLRALLQRAPRTAHRYDGETLRDVPVEDLSPGDTVLVGPGEVVPADGTLIERGGARRVGAHRGVPAGRAGGGRPGAQRGGQRRLPLGHAGHGPGRPRAPTPASSGWSGRRSPPRPRSCVWPTATPCGSWASPWSRREWPGRSGGRPGRWPCWWWPPPAR